METLHALVMQHMDNSSLLALLLIYLAGVLTSFTPCVYPVVPITAAYFGAQTQHSKWKTSALVLLYVCGMSTVYAALGMLAGLSGALFGKISTHPLTLLLFANICIVISLIMMDVFPLPSFSFLSFTQGQKPHQGFIGSFLIGAASGLVVGPCTTPVLAIILTYVGAQQSVFLGAVFLFAFSFGMGTLLMLVGLFAGFLHHLPKAGAWMGTMKKAFGVMMLLLAEYFLIKSGQGWF